MLSFHGDQAIKDKYIARVKSHALADEIVKGRYWENGKGCAVGCTIHSDTHSSYEDELGIPRTLAFLEDGIFDDLPNDIAKVFPLRFLEAIPVGVDLSGVFPRFMLWLLIDKEWGVIRFANAQGKKVINEVANLFRRQIDGEVIEQKEWENAAPAPAPAYAYAYAASAASAAYDAAYDADFSAFYAAAYDADSAAAYAAAAYADRAYPAYANGVVYAGAASYTASTAAYIAAKQKVRIAQADKLIELLKGSIIINGEK